VKRFLKLAVVIGLIATLGACAHGPKPEPEVRTVEVKVAVPVPCKATVTVRKSYSDAAAEFETDIFEQAKQLLTGRAERMADAERLKGAVTGCGGKVQ
jgi:hypothetical protein